MTKLYLTKAHLISPMTYNDGLTKKHFDFLKAMAAGDPTHYDKVGLLSFLDCRKLPKIII